VEVVAVCDAFIWDDLYGITLCITSSVHVDILSCNGINMR